MPRKAGKQQKPAPKGEKKQAVQKATKERDSDDELLEKTIALNAMMSKMGNDMPNARDVRFGREPELKLTCDEEKRRLVDARVLTTAAQKQIQFLTLWRNGRMRKKKGNTLPHSIPEMNRNIEELLVKALYILAGQNSRVPVDTSDSGVAAPPTIENIARLPSIFTDQHQGDILTEALLKEAEAILVSLLRHVDEPYGNVKPEEVVDALLMFPDVEDQNTLFCANILWRCGCDERAVRIYEYLMEHGNVSENWIYELQERIETVRQKAEQAEHQMGETELTCPICLCDCIRPCRPEGCPHIACSLCLLEHFKNYNSCPVCRHRTKAFNYLPDAEQVRYYYSRLDRNIDDTVAWYNLIFVGESALQSLASMCDKLNLRVMTKIEEVTPKDEQVTSLAAVNYAAQTLRRNPELAANLWFEFAQGFYNSTCFMDFETRLSYTIDLGGTFGKMTVLDAAIKALNSPYARNVDPWVLFAFLMCRDHVEEIKNDTFSVTVSGVTYDAIEFICRTLHNVQLHQHLFKRITCCLIYVMHLRDAIKNQELVSFPTIQSWKNRNLSANMIFEDLIVKDKILSEKRIATPIMYLAIAWRDLQTTLVGPPPTTGAELWGRAIEMSVDKDEITFIAEAIRDDEKALVDGLLIDKKAVTIMAERFRNRLE